MDLSIIIVNYRGWDTLRKCLDELATFRGNGFEFEAIIIDNNSGDGFLETFSKRYNGSFHFIHNEVNGGFANGCNLGASGAKGEFLLFLNPDTVASESAIAGLLEKARVIPDNSLISCRQVNSNEREKRAYGNFLTLSMLTGPGRAISRLIDGKNFQPEVSGNMIKPDWISGSVIMMRKRYFEKLGGFDEDYWMYFEDMDICRRARNNGGDIFYLTSVTIKHDHGGSSRIDRRTTVITKTEVIISGHVYVSKHFTGSKRVLAQWLLVFYNLLTGLINAVPGILLFFVPKISSRALIFFRLTKYYAGALLRRSWKSPLAVVYEKRVSI
jgi:hypothetical protein